MKDTEALLAQLQDDLKALEKAGRKAKVREIAQQVQANAAERARSAKVLAAIEAAEQQERERFVAVPMYQQEGRGLRARSLESREESTNYSKHVECEGVKRGEDSDHETVWYSAEDKAKLREVRERDPMGQREVDDETLMRRIDSIEARRAKRGQK